MVSPASDEFVNQVRAAVDIVDVIGEYVQLKKRGRNFVGLCPFHSEKTPSFNVNAERQFFHCFGCKAGGDVFSFLMQIDQLTFPEALRRLAERAGIPVPDASFRREAGTDNPARQAMYEAHRDVAKLYHYVLTSTPHGQEALRYLERRGLTPEIIREFQIGFAPNSWDFTAQFLQKRGYPLPAMVEAGLLARSENGGRIYDRFRGRIMFPIHNTQGEVIGFGGRSLDNAHPKYLNSPDSPLFHKSKLLFNLHRARNVMRNRNQAILLEGYVDVIALWQAGFPNGIATLGTALTEEQARLIRRNAENVVVCYDGDAAGQEATAKAVELLQKAGCTVRVAPLPQGMDPDDYIRRHGAEAFSQQVLLQAMPVTEFRLHQLRVSRPIRDQEDKRRFVADALAILAEVESAVERDMYERRLAEEFSLSLEALKQDARRVYKQQKMMRQRDKVGTGWNNSINNGTVAVPKALIPAHHAAERMLLHYMMRRRDVAERVQQECDATFHIDEHSALAAYLYAYYAEGYPEDPGMFIHYLQDEQLKQLASGLAMMECKEEASDLEIGDYIKQVKNYPIRAELDRLREQQRQLTLQAADAGDEETRRRLSHEASLLGMKIIQLENALKEG